MSRTNAVTATNNFVTALSHPDQFQQILGTISSPTPTQSETRFFIRAVLTEKPNLLIDTAGFTIFGIFIPFKALFKESLQAISHLLAFQRSRRTLFNEVITQTYSIRYYNFSLNTQIDSVIARDKLLANILTHFHTLNHATTREYVLQLREQNATNYSILKFFDKILN